MKRFINNRLATLLLVVAVVALALFIGGCSQKSVDPIEVTKNVPTFTTPDNSTTPTDSTKDRQGAQITALAGSYPSFCFALSIPWLCQLPPGTDWGSTNNCGQACAAMLGGYFNQKSISSATINSENDWLGCPKPYGCQTGASTVQRLLSGYHGLQSVVYYGSTPADPINEASRNRPAIVGVNIYKGNLVPNGYRDPKTGGTGREHWAIVVGWDGSNVIVHDPGTGTGAYRKYSVAAFDASWTTTGRRYIPVWK